MYHRFNWIVSMLTLMIATASCNIAAAQNFEEGKMYVSVQREYTAWANPLHSEFIINGETVDIFSSDTYLSIDKHLKAGWNDISIKTKAQEPANDKNALIFKIGPMKRNPRKPSQFVMYPVLWKFTNGTDWEFKNGQFLHPLGPGVKEVAHNYHLYWAGLEHENPKIKAGDYVLQVAPEYTAWNTPVSATIVLNGTPLNSFLLAERQMVVTHLLKKGKNEIKVISNKIANAFEDNDIKGSILGPAEWVPAEKKFMLKPITSFNAMPGWVKDPKTGQLNNPTNPSANNIDRTIAFMVKK